jgi:hypothetical protein
MAKCEYCGALIKDAENAIFDGDYWFCSYSCRGQWAERKAGNVPA